MSQDAALLARFPLFHGLAPEALARIAAAASRRRVRGGEQVFRQGEPAALVFLLLAGRLKVSQVTAEGQQMMVRLVVPGDLFGFARALARDDYPGTVRAAVASDLLAWPAARWEALAAATPRLAVNALRVVGRRLDEAHTRLREIATLEVERRVAHVVLRLIDQAGRPEPAGGGIAVDFPISRQDIAEMTGTTLHTVSRFLAAWEGRGIVRGGRQRLAVLDIPALRRIAEPG